MESKKRSLQYDVNGVTVYIGIGNITDQKVDCIVNAANSNLMHLGGVAGAILKAGGQ